MQLRKPKKTTSFFFLLIQGLTIFSLIIVFLFIFLIGEKPFLSSDSWVKFSRISIAILIVILGLGFFKLTIKDVTETLTYNLGVLLIHCCLCLGMGWAISSLMISFSSIAATQLMGEPAQYRGVAQKWYNSGRGCHHYLKVKLENMSGDVCIDQSTYKQISNELFEVSVEGEESQFGLIIKKWSFAEN